MTASRIKRTLAVASTFDPNRALNGVVLSRVEIDQLLDSHPHRLVDAEVSASDRRKRKVSDKYIFFTLPVTLVLSRLMLT